MTNGRRKEKVRGKEAVGGNTVIYSSLGKCGVKKYRVLADFCALNQLRQFYVGELQPEIIVHLCHHLVCLSTKWNTGCNQQKGGKL
jgi:hypothetical protein